MMTLLQLKMRKTELRIESERRANQGRLVGDVIRDIKLRMELRRVCQQLNFAESQLLVKK